MFEFYEVVKIASTCRSSEYISREGYVAGKTFQNDDHESGIVLGYGVYLFDLEEVVCFDADEMTTLGRFVDPGDVMSGESIRVRNEDGRGVIVEDE